MPLPAFPGNVVESLSVKSAAVGSWYLIRQNVVESLFVKRLSSGLWAPWFLEENTRAGAVQNPLFLTENTKDASVRSSLFLTENKHLGSVIAHTDIIHVVR